MSELRFDGRVAIVTGAGRGMGRAFALLLASRGASVVVNDLKSDSGELRSAADDVVEEIKASGGEAVASYGSVITAEGAESIVKTAIDSFGRVDILINNAGVSNWTPFEDIGYEEFERNRSVHYDGPWRVTRAAWPFMRQQKYGRILFITSHVGTAGARNVAHYGSAKWASAGMARMLSFEGGDADIRSNALGVLGYTRLLTDTFFTPDGAEAPSMDNIAGEEEWWKANFSTDKVAPVAAWLVHEKCHLNGEILDTGGGHTFHLFFSATEGFVKPDLTLEDVDENMPKILDASRTNVFSSVEAALNNRLGKLQAAGVKPVNAR
ncbi:SDR family NAD(P)-dependent oxidoreductase [Sphingobium sp. JS3065]|uniref:SDR family NAD(P)-dependent oxidoreductase n=1 Tax=Sphingobium sp. JS3065 TaxID=2970925 RepID=UPI002263E004|nr:SDR family NAD(P)-dependent oxidoreductase [Sphingobium sp. JS3065]UZW57453.1 SDR family NAD(P)-dependent oxidoreductase [Sphingobium sp. JS3065]